MRRTRFVLAFSGLLSCAALSASGAAISFTAGPTYDAPSNANSVDFNASGNLLTSTGGTDVAGFTANVAAAFAANRGGVVDFDLLQADGGAPSGTVRNLSATADTINFLYGGGKSIPVTLSRDARTAAYGSATAISGTNQFDLPDGLDGTQSFTLGFGPITGGEAGEALNALGFTAVSRNGVASTVSMTATFSDGTTSTLSRALAGTQNNNDTFYGFVAPAGQSVTSLAVTRSARVPFDDLGFVTTVPVPEPTTAAVVATAAAGLLARRRRTPLPRVC